MSKLSRRTGKRRDEEATSEELENGERCAICNHLLNEEYGRPIACESCGGDAVRDGDDE